MTLTIVHVHVLRLVYSVYRGNAIYPCSARRWNENCVYFFFCVQSNEAMFICRDNIISMYMTTSLRESDAWSLKSLIATTDYKQTNYIVIVMKYFGKSYTVTWCG